MKIGILTFHKTNNYGASLQAYALCTYLNKEFDAEIIDYRNPKMEEDLKKAYSLPDGFLNRIKHIIFYGRSMKNRKKGFASFCNEYSISKKTCLSLDELSAASNQYDYIFVGSDQVWNYNITNNDPAFYLSFETSCKKCSYAASFGLSKLDDDKIGLIKKSLSDFYSISVREKEGADIVNDIIGKKPQLVVDPTFLLSKEEWSKFVTKRPIKQPYLLIYCFGLTDDIIKCANEIASKKHLKVLHIDGSLSMRLKHKWVGLHGLSPKEWVNAFYYADYILTNSFHGTAFSLIMKKNFTIQLLPPPAKVNSRLNNILEISGLSNRLSRPDEDLDLSQIDYDMVSERINRMIDDSRSFIEDTIQNGKNK